MKKTASIYIPHYGCPNDCIFCNQIKISGKITNIDYSAMKNDILTSISTMKKDDIVEIAFFGGSFTAIEDDVQEMCLSLANSIRDDITQELQIKLSTRPDKIDERVIERLKKYNVTTVELGVQSLDEEVLKISNRGHDSNCVFSSSKMIKDAGIKLGIQIMIGLPKDTKEKLYDTVDKVIQIKPDIARIYPVLVIKDTQLENMYNDKNYTPISLEEAVSYAKYVYKKFESNNINVIRVGLQATDNITTGNDVVAGPFHSAFGEMVINEIYKDKIEKIIREQNIKNQEMIIYAPKKDTSKIIGNKKKNYEYFLKKYNVKLKIKEHSNIIICNKKLEFRDFLI